MFYSRNQDIKFVVGYSILLYLVFNDLTLLAPQIISSSAYEVFDKATLEHIPYQKTNYWQDIELELRNKTHIVETREQRVQEEESIQTSEFHSMSGNVSVPVIAV